MPLQLSSVWVPLTPHACLSYHLHQLWLYLSGKCIYLEELKGLHRGWSRKQCSSYSFRVFLSGKETKKEDDNGCFERQPVLPAAGGGPFCLLSCLSSAESRCLCRVTGMETEIHLVETSVATAIQMQALSSLPRNKWTKHGHLACQIQLLHWQLHPFHLFLLFILCLNKQQGLIHIDCVVARQRYVFIILTAFRLSASM